VAGIFGGNFIDKRMASWYITFWPFLLGENNMAMNADINEVARVEIRKALSKDYLGYEYDDKKSDQEHLRLATERVLSVISHLLQQRPTNTNRLGATVMTESASMRSGKDGLPGIAPRSL